MRLAVFAILTLGLLRAQPNTLTPDEKSVGWKLLFDGRTSAGWREVTGLLFPTTSWTIEDGCLKPFQNPDGNQDIRTEETYRNFDLRFEWKISRAGNSGVKYLVQQTDRWQRKGEKGFQARARGLEYQLTDDESNPDALSGPTRTTAALYSLLAPSKSGPARPDIFHQSRIVVKGDHVEHWLDGAKVLEFSLADEKVISALKAIRTRKDKDPGAQVQRDTMISLQNHNSDIWFRSIKILRLD